jgi:hypothetical protein
LAALESSTMMDIARMTGANARKTSPAEEPLFDPPRDVGPVTAVRGTLLLIDWRWLREHGLFEAYAVALGKSRPLLDADAADWVPCPLGLAHWEALDALGLSREQQVAMGTFMGEHAHNIVLATLVRLAGKLGMSPWPALSQCHKLWMRSWRGGGMAAYRTGAHSARIEVLEASVVESRCFRTGIVGTIVSGIAPFCRRPVVVEDADARTPTSISLRVSWLPS